MKSVSKVTNRKFYILSFVLSFEIWDANLTHSMSQLGLSRWGGCIVLVFDLAAVARSESLSWNRAWGQGSPGAPGGSGQCAGSAPGAGRSQAARVGVPVGRGWGVVTVVLSGVPTAAGNALGVRQGRGKPGLRGSRFRWLWVGVRSQLCSPGSPLRLGTPISYANVSPRIHI